MKTVASIPTWQLANVSDSFLIVIKLKDYKIKIGPCSYFVDPESKRIFCFVDTHLKGQFLRLTMSLEFAFSPFNMRENSKLFNMSL